MTNPDAGEVAVVGAGIAGLSAGFRLQQAGFRVRLFDSAHHVGGKMRTTTRDGFTSDDGASIVFSSYTSFLRLLQDAGLDGELTPAGTVTGFARARKPVYLDSQRLIRDLLSTDLLVPRAKASLTKLGIDLLRVRKHLDSEDLSAARDWDTESAADYADRRLHPEVREYLVEPMIRALFGDSAENVSRVILLYAVNLMGGNVLAFRSGMKSIATGLATGMSTELGAEVHEVREHGDGVRLVWTGADGHQHEDQTMACVLAVPAPIAGRIRTGLDPGRAEFLRSVEYTGQVNVKAALSKPPRSLRSVYMQVPSSVHPGLAGILADHNKAPGLVPDGKGMLGFYTVSGWARELMDEHDDVVAKAVIASASPILPDIEDDVEFVQVHRWTHMAPRCRAGYFRDLRTFLDAGGSRERIRFAGDWFSFAGLDTSAAAGTRAAREVAARFGRSVPA